LLKSGQGEEGGKEGKKKKIGWMDGWMDGWKESRNRVEELKFDDVRVLVPVQRKPGAQVVLE